MIQHSKKDITRIIAVAASANCLELYDFVLFPILLPIIAHLFFGVADGQAGLLIGYAGFAISFLVAPFASILWGYYGDKYGKDRLMKYSLIMMAVPSICIAMLPTYETIGVWAAILLLLCRVVQGFSASAEVLGSKIYAINSLPPRYSTLVSSLVSAGGALGVMLAVCMGMLVSRFTHIDYLWRVSFLLGALIFICVHFLRAKKTVAATKKSVKWTSIIGVVKERKTAVLHAFALSAGLGLMSYTLHSFMVAHSIKILMDQVQAYQLLALSLFITALSAVVIGVFSMYKKLNAGRVLPYLLLTQALVGFPLFVMSNGVSMLIIYMLASSVLLGVYASASGMLVIRLFSQAERFRGALVMNAFGVALFGGTAPFILHYLSEINIYFAGMYLSLVYTSLYLIAARFKNAPLY